MTEDIEHLADGGHVAGLRAWRRSQGRDHIEQLDSFYAQGLITEVLYRVRIGKEASVFCCRAGEHMATPKAHRDFGAPASAGYHLVAAKVYRARQYRFKNDAVYQEARTRGMKGQARRALAKKTGFGRELQTGSWVNWEYECLQMLHDAGCDVPRPIAMGPDSLLMEFIGDEEGAAPQLNNVELDRETAQREFQRTLTNVEIMLACHRVHGDLSAHNILFWDGHVVLIDLPQAVDARFNSQADQLLQRDVDNVCRYFREFGVQADSWELAHDLWKRYTFAEL